MNSRSFFMRWRIIVFSIAAMLLMSMCVFASDDDNSLQSLGITTEGVVVEPDFSYDTWEYTVTVPAGTKELTLDPLPSSDRGRIADISGTTLYEDGTGTVAITVEAGNGSQFTYTLNVVSDGEVPPPVEETETETETEKQTETERQTEKETEPATESNMVEVNRNTVQEAQDTISALKQEILNYRDTIRLYTYIIYGLIALAVVLLFLVINLLLRKNDLKRELKEYRQLGYEPVPKKGKKAAKSAKGEAMTGAPAGNAVKKRSKQMPSYEEEVMRGPGNAARQGAAPRTRQNPKNAPQAQPRANQAPAQQRINQAPAQPRVNQAPAQARPNQAPAQPRPNQAPPQPGQNQAPAPQRNNQVPNGANAQKPAQKDVQINMIDL